MCADVSVANIGRSCQGNGLIQIVDPREYPDWDKWLGRIEGSSFFHGKAWADVLSRTYGHVPLYVCRIEEDGIKSLLPLMEVSSWLTGRRGVSLPFTDSCPALAMGDSDAGELFTAAVELGRNRGWRYLECRGGIAKVTDSRSEPRAANQAGTQRSGRFESRSAGGLFGGLIGSKSSCEQRLGGRVPTEGNKGNEGQPRNSSFPSLPSVGNPAVRHEQMLSNTEWPGATPSLAFYGHSVDLCGGSGAVFDKLDPAVRRGIRKAVKSGVSVTIEHGLEAMRSYYQLHCQTRKRHGLPPQPWRFFENIQRLVMEKGQGFVALASVNGVAAAGAVFFLSGKEAIYKFGASNYSVQQLRANNLVMWEAIRHCAGQGKSSLDLGRTSLANEGLRRFKLAFGAREERIEYSRFDLRKGSFVRDVDRAEGWMNHIFRLLPQPMLRWFGRYLYRHLT